MGPTKRGGTSQEEQTQLAAPKRQKLKDEIKAHLTEVLEISQKGSEKRVMRSEGRSQPSSGNRVMENGVTGGRNRY